MLLTTEQINPRSKGIDGKPTREILGIINEEDKTVPLAVAGALDQLTPLVDAIVEKIREGGRLVYIGAGTSGRLGVLDASECPPTYGVSPDLVVGLIAGGDRALRYAVENAEDDGEAGVADLKRINFSAKDVLVGITASGEARYVRDAMAYALSLGSVVGGISCNKNSKIFSVATFPVCVPVGPEIVSGSTRMKSGTAQKLVLNMISTATMIKLGKVYDNYMVNLLPTNRKLVKRAKRLIASVSGCTPEKAEEVWACCHGNTPAGIVMAMRGVSYEKAKNLLDSHGDSVRAALAALDAKKNA